MLLAVFFVSAAYAVPHGPREQAKRIHDRIAGVPPSDIDLVYMADRISDGFPLEAAERAIENSNFYNVTLKTHVSPWTNRDQSLFVPLNDYTATVIGMVYNGADFRDILSRNVIYTYTGTNPNVRDYDRSNNQHYEDIEAAGINIGDALKSNDFAEDTQQSKTGIPADAAAGVMTTRAAAEAFFAAGTNRAMFRFTLLNHMCVDLEQVQDATRIPDRIRQDVSRSPGGDSRIFMNSCISCHSGMDSLAGAFAYYNFNEGSGQLEYTTDGVQEKYRINSNNFPFGYLTVDDSWKNYWRTGPNQWLGWEAGMPAEGTGAASMGREIAHSEAFAQCHVKKVFKTVCLREPSDADDRGQISIMVGQFNQNHDLKEQFKLAAVHCMGDEAIN
ncbi:hypothetical protein N9251_02590 [Gammaproteobacteria bacterium]|nr:hypothetical protein [Gammaproteobacteria bacterium]